MDRAAHRAGLTSAAGPLAASRTLRRFAAALVAFSLIWVLATLPTAAFGSAEGPGTSCDWDAGLAYGAFVTPDGRRGSILLWYPTAATEVPQRRGAARFVAALDAPPARTRRFGLLLISHDVGGSPLQHHALAAQVARCAWIVAAVEHPGTSRRDDQDLGTPAAEAARPDQLARALDAVLADPRFAGVADADRIAVLGHAAAATAVLHLAGAGAAAGESPLRVVRRDARIGALVLLAAEAAAAAETDLSRVRLPALLVEPDPRQVARWETLLPLTPVVVPFEGAREALVMPLPPPGEAQTEAPAEPDRPARLQALAMRIAGFLSRSLPARPQ